MRAVVSLSNCLKRWNSPILSDQLLTLYCLYFWTYHVILKLFQVLKLLVGGAICQGFRFLSLTVRPLRVSNIWRKTNIQYCLTSLSDKSVCKTAVSKWALLNKLGGKVVWGLEYGSKRMTICLQSDKHIWRITLVRVGIWMTQDKSLSDCLRTRRGSPVGNRPSTD